MRVCVRVCVCGWMCVGGVCVRVHGCVWVMCVWVICVWEEKGGRLDYPKQVCLCFAQQYLISIRLCSIVTVYNT